jgi:hypothetical protein
VSCLLTSHSNTSGLVFGASSPGAPARLFIDYIGAGCPAIGATDARDIRIENVVLDTQRLPWTDAVVSSSADGLSLRCVIIMIILLPPLALGSDYTTTTSAVTAAVDATTSVSAGYYSDIVW